MSALPGAVALSRLLPELALLAGAFLPLVWGRFVPGDARARGAVALGVGTLLTSSLLALGDLLHGAPAGRLWGAQLACDGYARVLRALFAWVAAYTLLTLLPTSSDAPRTYRATPRQVSLFVLAVLGMDLLSMSTGVAVAWLAAELVAVASVGLVALGTGERGAFASALKLAVVSAVTSAVLLYGAGWLYGLTGTLSFRGIGTRVTILTTDQGQVPEGVYLAGVLVLLGFAGKAGVLPFAGALHRAFRVAPPPVVGFLAVGPTAATLAFFVRFSDAALHAGAPEPSLAHSPWPVTLGLLGLATAGTASLAALREESLEGVLASAGVAALGAALVAVSTFTDMGVSAALFQIVTVSIAVAGAFAVSTGALGGARARGLRGVAALAGLGTRSPLAAAALTLFLFSLAGLPPLAGFAARLETALALLAAKGPLADAYALFVVGLAVVSVLGFAVAARLVRLMYFGSSAAPDPQPLRPSHVWAIVALVVPTLAASIWTGTFSDLLRSATLLR